MFFVLLSKKKIKFSTFQKNGQPYGYEFKWNPRKKAKAPPSFISSYANAHFMCITPENILEFVV